jgi:uncharacterized membrane protein
MINLDFFIKWGACFTTLVGAFCTSAMITPTNIYVLTVGGALYLWWSIRIREWNLIVINIALLVIYGSGTIKQLMG